MGANGEYSVDGAAFGVEFSAGFEITTTTTTTTSTTATSSYGYGAEDSVFWGEGAGFRAERAAFGGEGAGFGVEGGLGVEGGDNADTLWYGTSVFGSTNMSTSSIVVLPSVPTNELASTINPEFIDHLLVLSVNKSNK